MNALIDTIIKKLIILSLLNVHLLVSINMHATIIENNEHMHLSKKRKISSNQCDLRHLCLGHKNLNGIQRIIKNELLGPLKNESLPLYESCLEEKMTKMPFSAKGIRATVLLELVHTDVCGPINIQA